MGEGGRNRRANGFEGKLNFFKPETRMCIKWFPNDDLVTGQEPPVSNQEPLSASNVLNMKINSQPIHIDPHLQT